MSGIEVRVHRDADVLAAATAARLMTRIVDAQHARASASVVLTGGGVGVAVLESLACSPARDAVDWQRLDVWWGDERFLPDGDPERNDSQARKALLDRVPIEAARVHPMPAPGAPDGPDPEAAAAHYAEELAVAARPGQALPPFDVLLLGVGPEGHVASIFPSSPAAYEERMVVAVRNCPKPPPTRITLTLPTIRSADEVWLIAAGAAKAGAVGLALSGAGPIQVPAAGATGGVRTLWLLDQQAAAEVPPMLRSGRS